MMKVRHRLRYAVVTFPVISVYESPEYGAEMGTQLLLNETVRILSLKKQKVENWVKISCGHDGYVGWVDERQIVRISKDGFDLLNSTTKFVCGNVAWTCHSRLRSRPDLVSFGTPIQLGDLLHTGTVVDIAKEYNKISELISYSIIFLSVVYLWGGRSFFGVDCSGYMQLIFRMIGIKLPRNASQQAGCGVEVPFAQCMPGDLAFFHQKGKIIHVGLVCKDKFQQKNMIHASGNCVKQEEFNEKGIFHWSGEQTHTLAFIRRVIK
jgi:gamma-D-glutamyl-L-lysine dipeptidyl-peptidase